MNNSILGKYCVVTIGHRVSKIGEIKKVNGRTIHVDWGHKVMIYMNKDFRWIPVTKEEIEETYKKSKFTEETLIRAAALGIEIQ
ncbi:hypothetical protein ACFPYJ_09120 [Paenibacillus solisilvae]|uniref:Uncharacterized protein n=1 Tax=Paenibacillus solisilvae TaxID=2486751 RepID=A0ABW0VTS4_9BACL